MVLDVLGACPRGLVPRPGDIVISTQALLADPDTPPNLAAWARLRAHSGHIVVHLRHSLGVWAALDVLAGPDYRAAVTTDTGSVIEPDQVRPRHRPRR
ncbi:hypothetical protein SAMN04487818_10267 [Actinokineospora terrae]|uniref:Uncharacterized protein n=1 Tax=Actinokineospora terrae TaxID=155974 RepID=A0A1H9MBT1_9PSEU|nr:hypothetical protein SAMN04487818_10267 [Actinokineospora terrae]